MIGIIIKTLELRKQIGAQMKTSEFRKIIKEEVKNILSELSIRTITKYYADKREAKTNIYNLIKEYETFASSYYKKTYKIFQEHGPIEVSQKISNKFQDLGNTINNGFQDIISKY